MKSFIVALLIFFLIVSGSYVFCGSQEKTIDSILQQTEHLSVEENNFSDKQNRTAVQKAQAIWQEKLWFLELAVEEEYVAPVTANFADMKAGCESGDLSRYLFGKAGVTEGLLKLKNINRISLSQIF